MYLLLVSSSFHQTASLCFSTIRRRAILFSQSRALLAERRKIMRLGLWFSNYRWQGDQVSLGDTFATIAQRAERAGLASVWVPDHFLMQKRFGERDENMMEYWSALDFLARLTNRLQQGRM